MRKNKYYLAIDDYEYRVIIDSLNGLRNKLIADGNTPPDIQTDIDKRAQQSESYGIKTAIS